MQFSVPRPDDAGLFKCIDEKLVDDGFEETIDSSPVNNKFRVLNTNRRSFLV
ncbi:unnamed protein product, partial [Rotaria magnacalcarata]